MNRIPNNVMSEESFFYFLLWGWSGVAVIVFIILFFITAPYGRYSRRGWGPTVESKRGWIFMEAPASLGFFFWFILGRYTMAPVSIVFMCLWSVHYFYRAFIYPFRLHGRKKEMPLIVVGMAFLFNMINSYLNGRFLFTFSGGYTIQWLRDPRFVFGTVLFIVGFFMNHHADRILRNLRQPGESDYHIPHGGLFRWVSCPNYLGEIIEWIGWALATWSPGGLVFAIWTVANLVPRARNHHIWYQKYFTHYPKERRILIPWLW